MQLTLMAKILNGMRDIWFINLKFLFIRLDPKYLLARRHPKMGRFCKDQTPTCTVRLAVFCQEVFLAVFCQRYNAIAFNGSVNTLLQNNISVSFGYICTEL